MVTVYAVEADLDIRDAVSNTFTLEWPKGSGQLREFPEVDRVAWFPLAAAAPRLVAAQRVFLERLAAHVAGPRAGQPDGDTATGA